jgi:hypothetical protein
MLCLVATTSRLLPEAGNHQSRFTNRDSAIIHETAGNESMPRSIPTGSCSLPHQSHAVKEIGKFLDELTAMEVAQGGLPACVVLVEVLEGREPAQRPQDIVHRLGIGHFPQLVLTDQVRRGSGRGQGQDGLSEQNHFENLRGQLERRSCLQDDQYIRGMQSLEGLCVRHGDLEFDMLPESPRLDQGLNFGQLIDVAHLMKEKLDVRWICIRCLCL